MGRLRLDPERNVVLQEMVLPMSALKVLTAVSHGCAMHAELPVRRSGSGTGATCIAIFSVLQARADASRELSRAQDLRVQKPMGPLFICEVGDESLRDLIQVLYNDTSHRE
jgi:hypothetical protein